MEKRFFHVLICQFTFIWISNSFSGSYILMKRKVDRVTANHSLSSTASQGTSNIPFPCFLVLGCNCQAKDHSSYIPPGCSLVMENTSGIWLYLLFQVLARGLTFHNFGRFCNLLTILWQHLVFLLLCPSVSTYVVTLLKSLLVSIYSI